MCYISGANSPTEGYKYCRQGTQTPRFPLELSFIRCLVKKKIIIIIIIIYIVFVFTKKEEKAFPCAPLTLFFYSSGNRGVSVGL